MIDLSMALQSSVPDGGAATVQETQAAKDGLVGNATPDPAGGGIMIWPALLVLLVIVLSGLFGGVVSQFRDETKVKPKGFRNAVALGVAASLLIPLFLSLSDSELLKRLFEGGGEGAPYFQDVFVFAGMTVLAAIVSERFITSLSDRVFGELDELRDQIRNPEEEDTAIPITQATLETAQDKQELDPIQSSIVAAMMAKPTTRRAIGPVAIDVMEATNQILDRSVIETALKAIEAEGLVTRVPARNDGSPRYILDKAAPERLIKAQDGKIYLKDE